MIRRTYKIDIQVTEIRTYTVEVEKSPSHDCLERAYEGALAAAKAGNLGEITSRSYETVGGSHDLVSEVKDPTIEFENRAPAGTRYGWVITRDFLAEADERSEEVDPTDEEVVNDVGAYGPGEVALTREQIVEFGTLFRMYDDDDELYYEGSIAWAVDYKNGSGFEPLDDFGLPNAGCTSIWYQDTAGEWRQL